MIGLWVALAASVFAQDAAFTGAAVERDLEAGNGHSYRVSVQQGQFLSARAAQISGNVTLRLVDVAGKVLASSERLPSGGVEELPWLAVASGDYRVEVSSKGKARYRYEAEVRVPTDRDRIRAGAFHASRVEGEPLTRTALGRPEAVKKYQFAVEEWRKAGDVLWEGADQNTLGGLLFQTGQVAQAKAALERAVALLRDLPSERDVLLSALNNTAVVAIQLEDYDRSAALFEEVIRIREQMPDTPAFGLALNNTSIVYKRMGEFGKAEAASRRAIAIARQGGDAMHIEKALSNMAMLLASIGDHQGALQHWHSVLRETPPAKPHTAITGLAMVYLELGDYVTSMQYWEKAEAAARAEKSDANLAYVLYGIGGVKLRQGNAAASLKYVEESVAILRKMPVSVGLVNPLTGLCHAYRENGRVAESRAAAEEALAIIRRVNHKMALPGALACAARADLAARQFEGSRKLFEEALASAKDGKARTDVLTGFADLERATGNPLGALARLEEAIVLRERRASSVSDSGTRAYARSTDGSSHRSASEVLMGLHAMDSEGGHAERAFEMLERSRARTLAEVLAAWGTPRHVTREQAKEEDRLMAAMTIAQRDLFQAGLTRSRQAQLRGTLAAAERELMLFRSSLPSEFPQPDVLTLDRIQKELLSGGDAALLFYSLGPERSYVWAVTRTGFASAALPGRKQIQERVRGFRALLSRPPNALSARRGRSEIAAAGRGLYQMLIGPVEKAIAGVGRWIVVPDGALHSLPFEALTGGSGVLVERTPVTYAPSASVLAALKAREWRKGGATLLAFADPSSVGRAVMDGERALPATPLPNARREVEAIRMTLGGSQAKVYEGASAREQVLKQEQLEKYRYLHFAVHGLLDAERPARSGLVLARQPEDSEDGLLQAREIALFQLSADVVTLSACESGLGEVVDGEGVLGLSRAFLHAGARGLVVSLWNVNDAASAELMTGFYGNLKKGMTGAEALRRAKLGLIRQGGVWGHPYYWAPFVYIGR
ncbi:MAG: CHAT domain-containing protein [Acidobacteria bacterium]|nr:CHAT domain-containing protein [Acidobacteriota bacterium]